MNSNKKIIFIALFIAIFSLISSSADSQVCKDNYNNALNYYKKGQFENIYNYLAGCIDYMNNNRDHFRTNEMTTTFKVYKLIINSYRNLDQENLAVKKMNELVSFFQDKLSRQEVEDRLNETPLTPI